MHQAQLPHWENDMINEAIRRAERRFEGERDRAHKRAVQLAREQAYHRLAAAIDRPPRPKAGPGQLALFSPELTLFDDPG